MAGDAPLVRRGHDRGITTLTLDSPHNRNALSSRLVGELVDGIAGADRDPACRAVLLAHTGGTFCAGADLRDGAGGPHDLVTLLRGVLECAKPVVARVTGHVRAAGLGLLGACDIVAAGPGATFAFTEVRVGVAPAVVSLTLLPRLDPRAATRYCLTGERFDAAEAARIGLVTLVDNDPDAALLPVLDGLRRGSPQALTETKRLLAADVLHTLERDGRDRAEQSARLFASPDAREGIAAFLTRRDPDWAAQAR